MTKWKPRDPMPVHLQVMEGRAASSDWKQCEEGAVSAGGAAKVGCREAGRTASLYSVRGFSGAWWVRVSFPNGETQ